MIVVDASIAFKWLVEETGSEAALALATNHDLIAPSLLRAEVGNALFKKVRRGEIDGASAADALKTLDQFIGEWSKLADLAQDAFAFARELDHPIYDCYYLALAAQRDVGLATADERLMLRCQDTRFAARLVAWRT